MPIILFYLLSRNEEFEHAMSVWSQFHVLLNQLSLWFTDVELHLEVSAILDQPASSNVDDKEEVLKAVVVLEVC